MSRFFKIEPVNRKKSHGEIYEDHYVYNSVHVDDIPDDISTPSGVETSKWEDMFLWQYEDKAPVIILEDGPYARVDVRNKEARNQAYFALSVLADKGYVSGWKKL